MPAFRRFGSRARAASVLALILLVGACSSESNTTGSSSDDVAFFDMLEHDVSTGTSPTLRHDGAEVTIENHRVTDLDGELKRGKAGDHGQVRLHLVFDAPKDPDADYPIHYGFSVIVNVTDLPGTYAASFGKVDYDTVVPKNGAVVDFSEPPAVTSSAATGSVAVESFDATNLPNKVNAATVTLALRFDHVTFTTDAGKWEVDGPLTLTGGSGGTAGADGGGGGKTGADCLSGTWETPACGGAKKQTLSFTSGSGKFTNPDCNDICTDLIFPYTYTVSGDSVTLHYSDPPQPTCNVDNPPKLQKPATDDTFQFTCSGSTLVTTTSTGTVTYTRQ